MFIQLIYINSSVLLENRMREDRMGGKIERGQKRLGQYGKDSAANKERMSED